MAGPSNQSGHPRAGSMARTKYCKNRPERIGQAVTDSQDIRHAQASRTGFPRTGLMAAGTGRNRKDADAHAYRHRCATTNAAGAKPSQGAAGTSCHRADRMGDPRTIFGLMRPAHSLRSAGAYHLIQSQPIPYPRIVNACNITRNLSGFVPNGTNACPRYPPRPPIGTLPARPSGADNGNGAGPGAAPEGVRQRSHETRKISRMSDDRHLTPSAQ